MSIVSANSWGADYSTLKTLYVTLICTKIDYGSFLYETACKTNLIKIDRIQYAALRMMLGALKCTSVEKLELEANIISLVLRRKQLLLQYIHRAMSIPGHPFRRKLCNYHPFEFYQSNKRVLPVTGWGYRELSKLNISLKDFPPIHLPTHYKVTLSPAFSSLAIRRKLDHSPEQWQQMYSDLLEVQYPDRVSQRDGSVQGGDVSCAVYSEDFKVLSNLPAATSIFTAEIYAIYTAINFLENRPEKYIIISDSYSSIAAIRSLDHSKHYLLNWIKRTLLPIPSGKVIIELVPSHSGLRGNGKLINSQRQQQN